MVWDKVQAPKPAGYVLTGSRLQAGFVVRLFLRKFQASIVDVESTRVAFDV